MEKKKSLFSDRRMLPRRLPWTLLLISQLSKMGSRSHHVLSRLLTSVAFRDVSTRTHLQRTGLQLNLPGAAGRHLWEAQLPGMLALVSSSRPFGKGPAVLSFICLRQPLPFMRPLFWLLLLVHPLHEQSADLSLPGISSSLTRFSTEVRLLVS